MVNGGLGGCTEMACFTMNTPYCIMYADGRACTSPTACTGGANTGGGSASGARCSTTATRGQPNGVPCAAGMVCQITDPGHPEYDAPNSGVCVALNPDTGVATASTVFCAASAGQRCRMMCAEPACPAGQCAMRTGSCCDYSCQASSDVAGWDPATRDPPQMLTGACATTLATIRVMPGAYVPQCDEQGDYLPVQCHASVGSCWCVDTSGAEVAGTRTSTRNNQMLTLETCAAATHPGTTANTCDAGCQGVASRMPNRICPDGSMAGPVCAPDPTHGNECWWQIRQCPGTPPPPPPEASTTTVNPDGSVTTTYADGHSCTTYPQNGVTACTGIRASVSPPLICLSACTDLNCCQHRDARCTCDVLPADDFCLQQKSCSAGH